MAIDNPYKMQQRDDLLRIMTAPNAGAHNAVYRGKALGGEVTDAQWAEIAAGTFDDLYIGDYWTKDGIDYILAAFDYFLKTGDEDAECTAHHAVVVPSKSLYFAQMHNTTSGNYEASGNNTTAGGFVATDMYKKNLATASTMAKDVFGGHVLKHRECLTNAVTNGMPSGATWYDSTVSLLTEAMIYGGNIFAPTSTGNDVPKSYAIGKSQLPLFGLNPTAINIRQTWWLRDVVDTKSFSAISGTGNSYYNLATNSFGVRPYFLIG